MLLLHQVGSVKIGEVIRYKVTYTPSQDRILPSPRELYVRIRNTSTIALRAAFVHGPYTLSVSAYPSHFNPNEKFVSSRRYGVPRFEPMLKAGGSWECELLVPDNIRQDAGTGSHGGFGKSSEHDGECVSWVIEIASQVIFSTSAAVGFEVVLARDQKSLSLSQSLPVVGSASHSSQPGKITDHQQSVGSKDGHHPAQPKGVFSRAVRLKVEDSATLWNTPRLPGWDDAGGNKVKQGKSADEPVQSMVNSDDLEAKDSKCNVRSHVRKKKVHLVILTHGLHSNLGADMLYMKESIDAGAKQARIDAKARKARARPCTEARAVKSNEASKNQRKQDDLGNDNDAEESDDGEEVIVRGFPGNATKTEKGIKYLGKKLARYILSMTYPDQPFLPIGKGAGEGPGEVSAGNHHYRHPKNQKNTHDTGQSRKHTKTQSEHTKVEHDSHCRRYQITSISFVGHSLGGLVQTYAVAYIQKHSPKFFEVIQPINFIAMATPFLGLSNENPLYVKFALDFGLVGRTGQDLGLTWRAPTIARSGWGALVSNLGESAHKRVYGESQPESKPLLRILPTGPAHAALKRFRNRTVYSNVVNDGIVPLRTSCLLFLDWQGLGRVEKARRDAGLVETVVGFGWAELTGASMVSPRLKPKLLLEVPHSDSTSMRTPRGSSNMHQVPQPSSDAMHADDRASIHSVQRAMGESEDDEFAPENNETGFHSPLSGFFGLFKSNDPPKPQVTSEKQRKMLRRAQTIALGGSDTANSSSTDDSGKKVPGKVTGGHEVDGYGDEMSAPPKTTFFESAGDLLNPTLPSIEYLIDPSKRPQTIFHDRVYHPSDIPPPLPPTLKRHQSIFVRRKSSGKWTSSSELSGQSNLSSSQPSINQDSMDSTKDFDEAVKTSRDKDGSGPIDVSNMRVEEKIARAYHRDLSWRKVLVKLEPDAHNNMIVRRMFANAHGWPVIKHMVDAHFSDSEAARVRDEQEPNADRAFDPLKSPSADGQEVKRLDQLHEGWANQSQSSKDKTTGENTEEADEAMDHVRHLPKRSDSDISPHGTPRLRSPARADSVTWSDRDWADTDNDSDTEAHLHDKSGSQQRKGSAEEESRQQSLSSSPWNWAEKIVGKGSVRRSKSPQPDGAK